MSATASAREKAGSSSSRRTRYVVLVALAVPLLAAVIFALVVVSSHAQLVSDSTALARVELPTGGASVERLTVVGGREQKVINVVRRGNAIWPTGYIRPGTSVTVEATIKRPGWISWLSGSTERLRLTLTAPAARLRSHYLTRRADQPLKLKFREPVSVVDLGTAGGHLTRHVLAQPTREYSLPEAATAGSLLVGAAPRTWESPPASVVSWFPGGAKATAVAIPSPGTQITSTTNITLRFSKPVSQVLGSHLPPVSPATSGTWHTIDSHTIRFEPEEYGYGLGASVSVALPAGVQLVGGTPNDSDPVGKWSVPQGSTLRLQQLLSMLGYLPFHFRYQGAGVQPTLSAEVSAATEPPAGTFDWAYKNVPSGLSADWAPGANGVMTRGAIMAFEATEEMTPDGLAGPAVWKALINAALKGQRSTFGYTYVSVSEGSPESVNVWHNGKTAVTGPVNTGVPAAPTATGTFPVFEHLPSTTMTGINPDGSHYSDPGIPWVSYFNGGDALHGFIRASYGFPQSDGCVEMPYAQAEAVYPYTPVGTLVHVA